MTWAEFFSLRISHIYFVYGLAFFSLGLAVILEIGRATPTRFSRAMRPLAVFGLAHGSHEWIEMFAIVGMERYGFQPATGFGVFRLVLLAVSFTSLIAFGVQMLRPPKRLPYPDMWLGLGMLWLYALGVILLGQWLSWRQPDWFAAADTLTRYGLAIPGAVLAAGALLAQRRILLRLNQPAFANNLIWAALAFVLYGVIGQGFVGASPLFPSNVLNDQTFQQWFGIPIQLFRAITAGIIAIFTIRALHSFEINRRQALAAARLRVEEEVAQRDALRQEFLHRIVEMQEDERARIARELHDEFGQMLTGLALGLRGAQMSMEKPDVLQQHLSQLEGMAVQALDNMHRLVNELRPALLDDMGLPAALRHHKEHFIALTGLQATLRIDENHHRLPGEIETSLFRITQEALTNVARHAQATQVSIDLRCADNHVALQIEDNGLGFDSVAALEGDKHAGWGLIGIKERVRLVNGDMQIESEAGHGTRLIVKIPLKSEEDT